MSKNKDDLCINGNFKDNFSYYEEVRNRIIKLYDKKDCIIMKENENNLCHGLNFEEQLTIYNAIKDELKNSHDSDNSSKYKKLSEKFLSLYKDLDKYIEIVEILDMLKRYRNDIENNFTFDYLDGESPFEYHQHCFIRDKDELKCVYCKATTKNYNLTEDELNFLTFFAEKQGILLDDVSKEDMPFIQVFIEKQLQEEKERKKEQTDSANHCLDAEKIHLENEDRIRSLRIALAKAHRLDNQDISFPPKIRVSNPIYLSDDEKENLLENVQEILEEVKKSDSRFKELLIEQCNTAKYEILILTGESIPLLLDKARNESDLIALTKAYYNLSDSDFRINSEYFANNDDALAYDCLTANRVINDRILQMKLRRYL